MADPDFSEFILGLADGKTRGLDAGYVLDLRFTSASWAGSDAWCAIQVLRRVDACTLICPSAAGKISQAEARASQNADPATSVFAEWRAHALIDVFALVAQEMKRTLYTQAEFFGL